MILPSVSAMRPETPGARPTAARIAALIAACLLAALAAVRPASAASHTTTVAGLDFSPVTTGDSIPVRTTGGLAGNGTYAAAFPVPHGATVTGLSLSAVDPVAFDQSRLTLYRIDTSLFGDPNPEAIASVRVLGATGGQVGRADVSIAPFSVDLDHFLYYLQIDQDPAAITLAARVLWTDAPPASSASLGVAGLAFDPERSGLDTKGQNYGVFTSTNHNAPGIFVTPLRLPQGAVVTRLTMTCLDELAEDGLLRLVRVPRGSAVGETMAQVSSRGAVIGAVRSFSTFAITPALIDNTAAYYYLEFTGILFLDLYGARIDYAPPASPGGFDGDAIAALPFLPDSTSADLRAPVSGLLAGGTSFDLGLRLTDGEQILGLVLDGVDDAVPGNLGATLYRVDLLNAGAPPQALAAARTNGAAWWPRTFETDVLAGRIVDSSRWAYFVRVTTAPGTMGAAGVTVTTAPCGDHDGDGFDGCVDDCDDNSAAVHPGAPEICDGVVDDCNAPNWPDPSGTIEADGDGDGLSLCQGDCDDADATVWSPPWEVENLSVAYALSSGATTLTWSPPLDPGQVAPLEYDTLVSSSRSDFSAVPCASGPSPSPAATLQTPLPAVGQGQYYLVRAVGVCGPGRAGTRSDGSAVAAPVCP